MFAVAALVLSALAQPMPAMALVPPPGRTQWIKDHCIPLKTVEAGNGFDDLEPLKQLIGSARGLSFSAMPAHSRNPGSVSITRGIRVAVAPSYDPEQSDPALSRYLFRYRISITNESPIHVKLLSRHWIIVDADGERHEVEGEGVIGRQPELAPGGSFIYASFCPLQTPWGTMEGMYTMRAQGGEVFDIEVGRFYLALPADEPTSS